MAINERLIDTEVAAAGNGGGAGTGNQEEGLILHLDANDVDSYDGDGDEWVDITNHEYTPATNVSEHFNTVLYTGNGSASGQAITGVGFDPDLVWMKRRNTASDHTIVDSVRGANSRIFPNLTNSASTNGVFSFLTDGFNTNSVATQNQSGSTYVAWCFKAGGAPSGSDKVSIDGTSYATMSASGLTEGTVSINKLSVNTDLNFSIATYNGNNATGSVAHGLGVKPELIIIKSLGSSTSWIVYCDEIGATKYLTLNSTAAAATASNRFNNTEPNSNTWTFGTSDNVHTTNEHVVYSFASKRGVSKVGSYTGTGAAGNKVYTGFEPAFVMTKRTSTAGDNWNIIDNKRDTDTNKNSYLRANSNDEDTDSSSSITFNSDGFTLNGASFNTSGQKHIYYAVAKNTKETDLIDDTDLELHLDASDLTTSSTSWVDNIDSNNSGTLGNATYEKELGDSVHIPATGFSSGDVINFSNNPVHNQTTYTIESWVKFGDYSGTNSYITLSNHSAEGHVSGRTALAGYPTGVYRDYIDQTNYSSNGGITDGYWHHCVSVRQGTSLKQYLDGELVGTHTVSSNAPSSDEMTLGAYKISSSTYNAYFGGDIGQVRIYSAGLTQDQIRQNFNFTKPNYPNGFDGTITSATWNSGGYFDVSGASNSGIEIEELTTQITPNGNDSTMGGWFRKDNTNYGTFWSKGYSTNWELQAAEGSGNDLRYIFYRKSGSSVAVAESNSSLSTNTWYHIMGVIDWINQDVKIYLNGSLVGTNTTWSHSTSNQYLTGSVFLGRRNDNSGNLDGKVSAFKVYDRVLDTSEITALFDDEKANYGY